MKLIRINHQNQSYFFNLEDIVQIRESGDHTFLTVKGLDKEIAFPFPAEKITTHFGIVATINTSPVGK